MMTAANTINPITAVRPANMARSVARTRRGDRAVIDAGTSLMPLTSTTEPATTRPVSVPSAAPAANAPDKPARPPTRSPSATPPSVNRGRSAGLRVMLSLRASSTVSPTTKPAARPTGGLYTTV
jgi:hypothetical protein